VSDTTSKPNSMSTGFQSLPDGQVWARYIGTAAHAAVPGVPARDLTPDEVVKYGGQAVLVQGKCWEFLPMDDPAPDPEKEQ